MMDLSEVGLNFIKDWEKLELEAYHGAADPPGVWTIGYGHTRTAKEGQTITEEDALQLLKQDLLEAVLGVNKALEEGHALLDTSQSQFDAMVSLAFNVGVYAVQTSTLMAHHTEGNFFLAAQEFGRWHFSNKQRRRGLLRRRFREAAMYCDLPFAPV